jgi:hypothetical protein
MGINAEEVEADPREVYTIVSHDLWGLIGPLAEVYPNSRFILVTRDPRTTIVSWGNHPSVVQVEPNLSFRPIYHHTLASWERLVRFQDRPWVHSASRVWSMLMASYLKGIEQVGERGLIIRFEDVFNAEAGYPGMLKLAEYLEDLVRIPVNQEWLAAALGTKINTFDSSFPSFEKWRSEDQADLMDTCGHLMDRFGYSDNEGNLNAK